jgi:hypothetical protein
VVLALALRVGIFIIYELKGAAMKYYVEIPKSGSNYFDWISLTPLLRWKKPE